MNNWFVKRQRLFEAVILGIYFCYFAILRIFIVPFGDDQFWWGPAGKFLMDHHFFTLENQQYIGGSSNGRYVSNLSMIYTTHHPILMYLLFAVASTLLVWMIYRLTSRKFIVFILALCLPFSLSISFQTTTWFWYAAFINYVTGAVFIFSYLLLLKRDWFEKNLTDSWILTCAVFVLSVFGGLIVEHITLYQLAISIFSVIVSYFIYHKINKYQLAYLVGAIASAVIMFSNGSYWAHTQYRSVSPSISRSLVTYAQTSHFWVITTNFWLILLLCLMILVYNWQNVKQSVVKQVLIFSSIGFLLYYLIVNLYLGKLKLQQSFLPLINSDGFLALDSLMSLLFIAYLFVSAWFIVDTRLRYVLIFCLVSFLFLIAPFLVIVQPNSAREFFNGVLFLYLYGFLLLNRIVFKPKWIERLLVIVAAVLLIGSASYTLQANIKNHVAYSNRTEELTTPGGFSQKLQVPYPLCMPNQDLYITQDSIRYWQLYRQHDFWQRLWVFDYTK
ncbi:DUF6056 family protein [Companilactobacillus sp.]|jgi:hypothetical protein|uniref:DUF6056 family protein n=1 Tax=Companilactobacillus sp. TaxID=2767905 RepID=UPI0025C393D7|nr:DUF6056 family protein [Companilactobacillus sp.]MCH4009941.1 DUF6056 family protein [Companilactobacillus sp.]MCH4052383.1 DUF6056 family protein [Companilactobacillus sp.]MCH4077883.1 DUF6056 family protein [Companilactobacillus sp.]MCH4126459.1 DUF6056 family protein [Companilactobacillus sp.]MCH4132045.1 DUF6056 family protein [Companilactobacillus sp.]